MTFAADYPLLNIIWTMIVFFGFVIWIWLLFSVLVDVFRRHDLSGWGKAAWTLLIIVLPLIGVLAYLIAHGQDMAHRRAQDVQSSQAQFDDHIRTVAGGPAAQIRKPSSCSTPARSRRPSSTSSRRLRSRTAERRLCPSRPEVNAHPIALPEPTL